MYQYPLTPGPSEAGLFTLDLIDSILLPAPDEMHGNTCKITDTGPKIFDGYEESHVLTKYIFLQSMQNRTAEGGSTTVMVLWTLEHPFFWHRGHS